MALEKRVTTEKQGPPPDKSLWSIMRQMLAIALGIALSLLINLILHMFTLPNIAGGLITVSPGIIIPLFFGVTFGPIVGLLVGSIGTGIGELISYHMFYWNWDLGYGLIGCIMGFSVLFIMGRDRKISALVVSEIASIIAIVIGIGFAAFTDIWVLQIDGSAAASEFLFAGTTNACNGLILLPIVLIAYTMVGRKKRRSRRSFSPM